MKLFLCLSVWVALVACSGCASVPMDGSLVLDKATAKEVCLSQPIWETSYKLKPGETLKVYGPWRSDFSEEGFFKTGDRMWQVLYVKPANRATTVRKAVWVNAETGKVKTLSVQER